MPTHVLSSTEWSHELLWLPHTVGAPLPMDQPTQESCSGGSSVGGTGLGWRTVEVVVDLLQPRSDLILEIRFDALDSACGDARITSSVLIDDISVEAVMGPRDCPYEVIPPGTTACVGGDLVTPAVMYSSAAGSAELDCGYCYGEDPLLLTPWTARSVFAGVNTSAVPFDRGSDLDTRYVEARLDLEPWESNCQADVCTWLTHPNGLVPAADTCEADLDGDGLVGGADLGVLLTYWGFQGRVPADLNGDGVVDGADYGLLLSAWGPCCP